MSSHKDDPEIAAAPSTDPLEALAAAIYAEGDEPEWLTTIDGSPNAASYEHAQRVLNSSWYADQIAAAHDHKAFASHIETLADWHDTKADKARRFPAAGHTEIMEKAAQVHNDAAARLRELLRPTTPEDGQ